MSVHYISNKKAWVNNDIMEIILSRLDHKMKREYRKVILFLDNAICHTETLQKDLRNINLVFLTKTRNDDSNLSMKVSLGILNTSTDNYFFVL